MKLQILLCCLLPMCVFAGHKIIENDKAITAEMDGETLWTFNHDPAEGKPYFHPLAATDGTMFTGLRPDDHVWHRGVWFSWKSINGVNYWEENKKTFKSEGETRIVSIDRSVKSDSSVLLKLSLDYAPAGSDAVVMREQRSVAVSTPDANGVYHVDWTSTFTAAKDITLERTPIPGQEGGKSWGGYAGWSVRMNAAMKGGTFINSEGAKEAHRAAASWMIFNSPKGGSLLFMDHPDNFSYPTKWYIAAGMPYFSPAVIHDATRTMKKGEKLTLTYRLVVSPKPATENAAADFWNTWIKK